MKINEIRNAKDLALWTFDQILHGLYVLASILPVLLVPNIFGVCLSGAVVLGVREVEQARKASKGQGWYGFWEELLELDRSVDVLAGTALAVAALAAWL
jgi:hypothetical protein